MVRKILALVLKLIASAVLKKYKPRIVAVTGSVGKSTTKEAIFAVLSKHFKVRRNLENFNTEIGVPLTIIGGDYAGGNPMKWLWVIFKGLGLLFNRADYPKILILEMGADRPGDLKKLTSFAAPEVGLITNIGVSHLEFFKTKEALQNEKAWVVRRASSLAVLNADDEPIEWLKTQTKANIKTFAISGPADFTPEKVGLKPEPEPLMYAKLAAIAAVQYFGTTSAQAVEDLEDFKNLRGRMQIIKGASGATIIDDTYNSAPASAVAALKFLKNYPGGRKIAVLGKMAELGAETERGHRDVGKTAAGLGIDLLFVKNNAAAIIGQSAKAAGLQNVRVFNSSEQALEMLNAEIRPNDVILLKASQSEYFEDIIKGIMAEPERAKEFLVQRDYTRPKQ